MRTVSSMGLLFFFSSRTRHTRWNCDWSSDVCSSDLNIILMRLVQWALKNYKAELLITSHYLLKNRKFLMMIRKMKEKSNKDKQEQYSFKHKRSEERRVGKECRSRESRSQQEDKHLYD